MSSVARVSWSLLPYDLPTVIDILGLPCFLRLADENLAQTFQGHQDTQEGGRHIGVNVTLKRETVVYTVRARVLEFDDPVAGQKKPERRRHIGKEIYIPLEYSGRVRLTDKSEGREYFNVKELIADFPRFVIVLKDVICASTSSSTFQVVLSGTILELDRVSKSRKISQRPNDTYLLCKDRFNGRELAFQCRAFVHFRKVADRESYRLKDFVERIHLPRSVEFVSINPYDIAEADDNNANTLLTILSGPIELIGVCRRNVLVGFAENHELNKCYTVVIPTEITQTVIAYMPAACLSKQTQKPIYSFSVTDSENIYDLNNGDDSDYALLQADSSSADIPSFTHSPHEAACDNKLGSDGRQACIYNPKPCGTALRKVPDRCTDVACDACDNSVPFDTVVSHTDEVHQFKQRRDTDAMLQRRHCDILKRRGRDYSHCIDSSYLIVECWADDSNFENPSANLQVQNNSACAKDDCTARINYVSPNGNIPVQNSTEFAEDDCTTTKFNCIDPNGNMPVQNSTKRQADECTNTEPNCHGCTATIADSYSARYYMPSGFSDTDFLINRSSLDSENLDGTDECLMTGRCDSPEFDFRATNLDFRSHAGMHGRISLPLSATCGVGQAEDSSLQSNAGKSHNLKVGATENTVDSHNLKIGCAENTVDGLEDDINPLSDKDIRRDILNTKLYLLSDIHEHPVLLRNSPIDHKYDMEERPATPPLPPKLAAYNHTLKYRLSDSMTAHSFDDDATPFRKSLSMGDIKVANGRRNSFPRTESSGFKKYLSLFSQKLKSSASQILFGVDVHAEARTPPKETSYISVNSDVTEECKSVLGTGFTCYINDSAQCSSTAASSRVSRKAPGNGSNFIVKDDVIYATVDWSKKGPAFSCVVCRLNYKTRKRECSQGHGGRNNTE